MKIQNLTELATTPARRAALEIAEKGLEAIDTRHVLEKSINSNGDSLSVFGKDFKLSPSGKLVAISIGKCAGDAAAAFEKILDGRLASGVALGVGSYLGSPLHKIAYHAGTHPMPSDTNVTGTTAILNSLSGSSAHDTVIFLISGGGSTLLSQPPCILNKNESAMEATNREKGMLKDLFKAGATIQEINTVRKHMSLARGGFLAMNAYPAQVISIIFSDVPGDELGFISSGPTVKDETTVGDAMSIIKKYALPLDETCLIETPKEDQYFERVTNILALSNETALKEMKLAAESMGFKTEIKNTRLVGEAREVGTAIAKEIGTAPSNTVLLYCGETTVTIKGGGKGGRNQELALSALMESGSAENRVVLSLASDGHDNGPHAGALADSALAQAAQTKGLKPAEFLARNDSSAFFEKAGGLIETGDTGSNVSDLIIAVAGK